MEAGNNGDIQSLQERLIKYIFQETSCY